MSKKRRNNGKSSPSHKLYQDAYAVVNTIMQQETNGMGEVLTAQEISTIDVSTPYALTPVYFQENQDKPAILSIFLKKYTATIKEIKTRFGKLAAGIQFLLYLALFFLSLQ